MTRSAPSPKFTDDDMKKLQSLRGDRTFSQYLEQRYRIKITERTWNRLISCLDSYADSALRRTRNQKRAMQSSRELVAALDNLFSVMDRQRQFPVWDERRESLEYFVMYSQRPYPAHYSKADVDRENLELGRWACRDKFETFSGPIDGDSYDSLGSNTGWLENLLRQIRADIDYRPASAYKRGPKGKHIYRSYVIWEMANIFEISGGTVKAYKSSSRGMDGAFIRFAQDVFQACPKSLSDHLSSGFGDAVYRWIRAGRPAPTEGIVPIPLPTGSG